jgi:hypothetical protein
LSEQTPSSPSSPTFPSAGDSPWRDLLTEGSLRRMGRLASVGAGEVIAWIGEGNKVAQPLAKNLECELHTFEDLAAFEAESGEEEIALIVAPDLARQLGLEQSLQQLRPYLRFDGAMGLVCRAWLQDEVSGAVRDFYGRHHAGELRSVKDTLASVGPLGYEPLTVELLPEEVWAEHYRRLGVELAKTTPEQLRDSEALLAASEELLLNTTHGRETTLGLFVGRRLDPDAPPRWPRRGFSD